MGDKQIPVAYQLILERAKIKCDNTEYLISRKNLFCVLGEIYHIPKDKRIIIINEMVDCYNLIRRVNGNLYKLN
jgi:hypothetical protein